MRTNKRNLRLTAAQATIEFVFAFLVVALMLYGCVKALQWLGLVLGSPVAKHYQGLYAWGGATGSDVGNPTWDPQGQLSSADAAASQGMPKLILRFTGQLINP